ncbi:MAG: ADOP family duplicated permease [Vicinamibacterales bacterium]
MFGLLSRRRQDDEFQAELDSHLQLHIDDNLRAGMSEREARRQAMIRLGSAAAVTDALRDTRRVPIVDAAIQDVRDGVRAMRRSPMFTAMAVVTLAVTIGALSTVATMANTLLWRLPSVPDASELVKVQVTRDVTRTGYASYPDYVHLRDSVTTLDLAAHYSTAPLFVTVNGSAIDLNGAVVSANYFSVLQLQPAYGRFFRGAEDEVPDRDRVVVVSHGFWQRWFGGSPGAIGAEVDVNGVAFTIVGVAPQGFPGLEVYPAEIYLPTMMLGAGYRWCVDALAADCTILEMIGRLTPGHSMEEARAEVPLRLPHRWADPGLPQKLGVALVNPRGVGADRRSDQMITMLMLASVVLLLVCCANLAGLLVARGSARLGELGVRSSLGASRSRLVRQLMSESLLLSLCGGALGVLCSVGATRVLAAMFFAADESGRPQFFDLSLQPPVVIAIVVVSLLAGVGFGVLPALKMSRSGAASAFGRHERTVTRRTRATAVLLALQAAVAVVLITLAGSFAQNARGLVSGTNYDPSHVALLRLRPRLANFDPPRGREFVRRVVERLAHVPGVESVTFVGTGAALLGLENTVARPDAPDGVSTVGYIEVGPRYFETVGTPLLRGREFEPHDRVGSPLVAVVSRALAAQTWPGEDPLGKGLLIDGRQHTVIGLVEDVALQPRAEAVVPYAFAPFWQNPAHIDARLQVRVAGDPAAMIPALVKEIGLIDPDVPVTETGSMAARMAGRFRSLRMTATFVSFAGGVAIALTLVGLYGALAFSVASRTREIGVRLALGAPPRGILAMVTREGLGMVGAGALLGVGLAYVSSRSLQGFLYGPAESETPVVAMAFGVIVLCSLAATLIPAVRASRIAPTQALRQM